MYTFSLMYCVYGILCDFYCQWFHQDDLAMEIQSWNVQLSISIYIYIIVAAERKWIPTIKEVVTRLS